MIQRASTFFSALPTIGANGTAMSVITEYASVNWAIEMPCRSLMTGPMNRENESMMVPKIVAISSTLTMTIHQP